MNPPRACLFDYGNTIVEFDDVQIHAVLEALRTTWDRLLPPVSLTTLRDAMVVVTALPHLGRPPSYREHSPVEQMALLVRTVEGEDRGVPRATLEALDRTLQDAFVANSRIASAEREAILGLAARMPVGLVSNYACASALRRSVEEAGLGGVFSPLIVSGDMGFVKPHPSLFLRALDALCLEPEEVLYVGDRWDADMVGASRVGLQTCQILGFTRDRDLATRYRSYRPDHCIARLSELEEIL